MAFWISSEWFSELFGYCIKLIGWLKLNGGRGVEVLLFGGWGILVFI